MIPLRVICKQLLQITKKQIRVSKQIINTNKRVTDEEMQVADTYENTQPHDSKQKGKVL